MSDINVGDTVRIGKGKKLWRVRTFWTASSTGVLYADLRSATGYSQTSATPDRLTIVTKTGTGL